MEVTANASKPVAMPERFGLAEHKRNDWVLEVPVSVSLEQAMESSYYAHIAAQMEPLDNVQLCAEDGSWVADLVVQFCERNYARVVLKTLTKLEPTRDAPASSVEHRVEWKGPALRWCVIRNSDNKIIKDGLRSKELGHAERLEHEKSITK